MKTVSSDDNRPAPDSGRGQAPPADNDAPITGRIVGYRGWLVPSTA
jgi:hypothetical protein